MQENNEEIPITVPVVLTVYKRLEKTKKVLEAIRNVRPEKLYLIADGPKNQTEEIEKVKQVREYLDSSIDWPCEVIRDYAQVNMGNQKRMVTGFSRVFDNEEYAIILEDDDLPDITFFRYCQELLEKYKDDTRVMIISGLSVENEYKMTDSYTFTYHYASTCGFATWKRVWKLYDPTMQDWPRVKRQKILSSVCDKQVYKYLKREFDVVRTDKKISKNIWDYQFTFCRLINGGLGITPCTNLITNIGEGEDSTFCTTLPEYVKSIRGSIQFPLRHPKYVLLNREYDKMVSRKVYGGDSLQRKYDEIIKFFKKNRR